MAVTSIDSRFGKSMDVLMSANDVIFLTSLVRERKPIVTVEIGSWEGGSSSIFARHSGLVFCVDTWEDYSDTISFEPDRVFTYTNGDDRFRKFCANMGEDLFTKVFPCRGDSKKWAEVWRTPIDFLFIDGCHSYEAVKADIDGWLPHVEPGGIVLGHDYSRISDGDKGYIWEFPGVAKAVHESFEDFFVIPGTTFWMVIKEDRNDRRGEE